MSITKSFLAIFVILTVFAGCLHADWEDRFGQSKVIYLSDILEDPDSWFEVVVRIPLRFEGIRNVYTPFFSHFDREHDVNFSAWDIHSPIWERRGFRNDYPFFYVPKDNPELKTFLKLRRFETISVLGKVAAIFKDRPYIKVVYVCRMPGELNINNLTLLNRGMRAYKERRFELALGSFQKIFHTNPPDDIKALLHKLSAKIYLYEKKSFSRALFQLEKGLAIAENDGELNEMYTQCKYYMKHGGQPPHPLKVKLDLPPVEEVVEEEPAVVQEQTVDETTPTINEVPNVYEEPIETEEVEEVEETVETERTGEEEEEVLEYWEDEEE